MSSEKTLTSSKQPRGYDPSFGKEGIADFSKILGLGNLYSASTQLGTDFLCGGFRGDSSALWIVRLLQSGVIDPSFGKESVLNIDPEKLDGTVSYMQLGSILPTSDPDYFLVIAWAGGPFWGELCIIRCNSTGTIDTRFGTRGMKRLSVGQQEGPSLPPLKGNASNEEFALTQNEMIYVTRVNKVIRLTQEAELDTSFGNDGILTVSQLSTLHSFALQPTDGKLLLGGSSTILRFTPDGKIDESFGANGSYTLRDTTYVEAIAADLNGYITYITNNRSDNEVDREFLLGQLINNGTFDSGFNNGKQLKLPSAGTDRNMYASLITIDEQNRRCIAVENNANAVGILRILRNGHLDESFADRGSFQTKLSFLGDVTENRRGGIFHFEDRVVVFGLFTDFQKKITTEAQGIV